MQQTGQSPGGGAARVEGRHEVGDAEADKAGSGEDGPEREASWSESVPPGCG